MVKGNLISIHYFALLEESRVLKISTAVLFIIANVCDHIGYCVQAYT